MSGFEPWLYGAESNSPFNYAIATFQVIEFFYTPFRLLLPILRTRVCASTQSVFLFFDEICFNHDEVKRP